MRLMVEGALAGLALLILFAAPAYAVWLNDTAVDFEMSFEVNDPQTHELAFFCAPGGVRGAYLGVKVPAGTQPPPVSTITFQSPNTETLTSPARVTREVNGWMYVYFNEGKAEISALTLAAERANPTISISMALADGRSVGPIMFSAVGSDRSLDRLVDRCRDRFGR
jgi:hypothetical protein